MPRRLGNGVEQKGDQRAGRENYPVNTEVRVAVETMAAHVIVAMRRAPSANFDLCFGCAGSGWPLGAIEGADGCVADVFFVTHRYFLA